MRRVNEARERNRSSRQIKSTRVEMTLFNAKITRARGPLARTPAICWAGLSRSLARTPSDSP